MLPGFVERRRHNFEMLLSGLQEVQDKLILPVILLSILALMSCAGQERDIA